jgi:hypothetical protein
MRATAKREFIRNAGTSGTKYANHGAIGPMSGDRGDLCQLTTTRMKTPFDVGPKGSALRAVSLSNGRWAFFSSLPGVEEPVPG